MKAPLRILHLEDSPNDASLVQAVLAGERIAAEITIVSRLEEFRSVLAREELDLILSDFTMPNFSGRSALEMAREKRPEVPFLFLSGTIGEEFAIQVLKEGATDCVLKDRMEKLPPAIRRAMGEAEARMEHKKSEEALHASEERFRLMLDSLTDHAIFMLSPEGIILNWNSGAQKFNGYQEKEIIGKHFEIFYPPENAQNGKPGQDLQSALAEHRFEAEGWRVRKDGTRFWANVVITPVRDKAGALRGFCKVTRDLTERKRAEEELKAQAKLLNLTKDAVWVCDLAGKILYCNKGAERLHGWESDGTDGGKGDVLPDPARQRCLELTLATGQWDGELTKPGRYPKEVVILHSRCSLMRDDGGQPISILVVESDVTEQKRIEAESLRNQRVQSIGGLAGGIAHDLNNALAPVLMGANLLRKEPLSADGRRTLELMTNSARRGCEMIAQILSFSRGVGGRQTRVDLQKLVAELAKLAERILPSGIQIQSMIQNSLHPVKGNSTQLYQVLLNLIVNARDAMPEGGTLTIKGGNVALDGSSLPARQDLNPGPYVLLQVTDTGHGMSPELLERVFEPFFSTKEASHGIGLGLSTAMGIVKMHGGYLDVASEVGKGTTFKVYLPADVSP